MNGILKFLHAAEKLKCELRHSWTSSGRRESVADHSWRVALMALALSSRLRLDTEKCLKMALLHDIGEIYSGDSHALKASEASEAAERAGVQKLLEKISDRRLRKEIGGILEEFENLGSREARFVRLLDKLEVLIQHNEAPFRTWNGIEKKHEYGMAGKHAEKFGFLQQLARLIDRETGTKLRKAGAKPKEITEEDYARFFGTYLKRMGGK